MVTSPSYGPAVQIHEDSEMESSNVHNDTNIDHLSSSERALGLAYDTHFTSRAIVVGLLIGVPLCFCNVYFGIQTGWGDGMSIPASLMGFALFKAMSRQLTRPFTPVENVLIQTVAGATATMPLGSGFTGIMPAIEFLLDKSEGSPIDLSLWRLLVWSVGLSLFGVIFAVPLRREVIIREKLRFPTGTATAITIGVLHGKTKGRHTIHQTIQGDDTTDDSVPDDGSNHHLLHTAQVPSIDQGIVGRASSHSKASMQMLIRSFGVSGLYVRLYQRRHCA